MKLSSKVLIYFLICLIASWYAIVLYWIYEPNPGIEYRLFYIDKLLSNKWPGLSGLDFEFGTKLSFKAEANGEVLVKNKGQGWSEPEAGYTWTVDNIAVLYFTIEDDIISGELESDIIIKAQVQAFLAQEFGLIEQLVIVKANDHEIDTWVINKEGFIEHAAVIPAALLNDQLLKISFELPNATSPNKLGLSEDSRNLGLAFEYIIFDKSLIPNYLNYLSHPCSYH